MDCLLGLLLLNRLFLELGIEALIGRGKINNDFGDGGSGSFTKEVSGLELEKKPVQGMGIDLVLLLASYVYSLF